MNFPSKKPEPTVPSTALVRSTLCTHVHPDLPELTGGQVVEIPLLKLSTALALPGVELIEKD